MYACSVSFSAKVIVFCFDTRTEYWQSQAKKFCDFCKCWLTDNKPVSTHYLMRDSTNRIKV